MHVTGLMHTDLETIATTDTIASAIAVLADSHVSGLPVLDEAVRFVGLLTASDILQGVAERDDPKAREALRGYPRWRSDDTADRDYCS